MPAAKTPAMIEVIVRRKRCEAEGIFSFRLEPADAQTLPAFSAGAHIDVQITDGLLRQYSLCNEPGAAAVSADHYLIAVLDDPASRGGSCTLCRDVAEGDRLWISAPRNHFALHTTSEQSVLIAGGIGITPILAMADSLRHGARPFTLHYCARSQAKAAFRERLDAAHWATSVHWHFDDGAVEQRFDADAVLAQASRTNAHLYVCGPSGFIDLVLAAAQRASLDPGRIHREYFINAAQPQAETNADTAFDLEIASTGNLLHVDIGETAISVLCRHGYDIPSSCEQGVCGTCLTGILTGIPDHRDSFLTDAEKSANDQFLPCCSRAKTPCLKLDL